MDPVPRVEVNGGLRDRVFMRTLGSGMVGTGSCDVTGGTTRLEDGVARRDNRHVELASDGIILIRSSPSGEPECIVQNQLHGARVTTYPSRLPYASRNASWTTHRPFARQSTTVPSPMSHSRPTPR